MTYSLGLRAKAVCDRCGLVYKHTDLMEEWTGFKVCRQCYEPKHPQLEPNPVVMESESLYDPRPEIKEALRIYVGSQYTFPPTTDPVVTAATGVVGAVTVTN